MYVNLNKFIINIAFSSHSYISRMNTRGILCVIGGISLHIVLGNVYLWGGISMYCSSYLFYMGDTQATTKFLMMFLIWKTAIMVLTRPLGVHLEKRFGPTFGLIIGAFVMIFCFSQLIYMNNRWGYLIFLSLGFSIPDGLGYIPAFAVAWRHFPKNTGLITGIIGCAYGCGSSVINIIAMEIVNPLNIQPQYINNRINNEKYFGPQISKNVPKMWFVIIVIWTILLLISIIFIRNPPKYNKYGGTGEVNNLENEVEEMPLKNVVIDLDRSKESKRKVSAEKMENNSESGGEMIERKPNPNTPNPVPINNNSYTQTKYIKSIKEGIKSSQFWLLNYYLSVGIMTTTVFAFCLKPIGQHYGMRDHFLTIIGTLFTILLGVMRIVWGYLFQIFKLKIIMMICLSGIIVCTLLTPLVAPTSQYLFAFFVLLGVAFMSAVFPIIPAACNTIFGPNFGGALFSYMAIGNFLVTVIGCYANYYLPTFIGYNLYLPLPALVNAFGLYLTTKLQVY